MRRLLLLIAITAAAIGLGLPGAASCQPALPSSSNAAAQPIEKQETQSEPTAVDPGFLLIKDRCSACHSADYVLGSRRTATDWHDTILQMIGRGAEANESEVAQIQAYLEKNRLIAPR